MRYVLDTSFLVGLSNMTDKYHELANTWLDQIRSQDSWEFYISDYVIDEFLSILIKGQSISEAIEWGRFIYNGEFTTIIYCNEDIHQMAWKLLEQEDGERKPLNLTDCVVYITNFLIKGDEILTYDSRLQNYNKTI